MKIAEIVHITRKKAAIYLAYVALKTFSKLQIVAFEEDYALGRKAFEEYANGSSSLSNKEARDAYMPQQYLVADSEMFCYGEVEWCRILYLHMRDDTLFQKRKMFMLGWGSATRDYALVVDQLL